MDRFTIISLLILSTTYSGVTVVQSLDKIPNSNLYSDPDGTKDAGNTTSANFSSRTDLAYGEHQWTAAILEYLQIGKESINFFLAMGSLIHPQILMTSAHSIYGKNIDKLIVRFGEFGPGTNETEEEKIKEMIIHPGFDSKTFVNDIAIIVLEDSPHYPNDDVITLPEFMDEINSTECKVIEWDKRKPHKLVSYETSIVDSILCQNAIRQKEQSFVLDQSFICADAPEVGNNCDHDSGSPVICRGSDPELSYLYQVGILTKKPNCRKDKLPNLFTDVVEHFDWIVDTINNNIGIQLVNPRPSAENKNYFVVSHIPKKKKCQAWKDKFKIVRKELVRAKKKLCKKNEFHRYESKEEKNSRCSTKSIKKEIKKILEEEFPEGMNQAN